MKNQTDTLESNMDTFGTDLLSLKTVMSVQEHVIRNNTYQIADLQFNRFSEKVSLELQSATTKELKADVKSQGDNFLALNETAVQLKTLTNELNYTLQNERSNIAQLEAIIQDISSRIVQLESNRSADRELIQRLMFEIDNHEDNVTELESNMAADRRLILRLSTDASSLKANLTSTTALIKTQGEILMAMNETLLQMGIVTNQLNASSQANTDMLAEQDVEIERRLLRHQSVIETSLGNIGNNTDKIRFLKANVSFVQDNFENLRSNLTYMESKIATTNDGVENNTDAITALFVAMQALNGSTSDSISRLRTELTEINGNNFVYYITLLLIRGNCHILYTAFPQYEN